MWKVVQSEACGPVRQHANSGRKVPQFLLVPRLVPLVELLQRPGLGVEDRVGLE